MQELDQMFGTDTSSSRRPRTEQEREDANRRRELNMMPQEPMPDEDDFEDEPLGAEDDEDINRIKDPYARQKATMMKHQEYRTIKVGPVDLLKNGQMI